MHHDYLPPPQWLELDFSPISSADYKALLDYDKASVGSTGYAGRPL